MTITFLNLYLDFVGVNWKKKSFPMLLRQKYGGEGSDEYVNPKDLVLLDWLLYTNKIQVGI